MHTVVNHLPFKPDADWSKIVTLFQAFADGVRASHPGMSSALLLKVSDTEGIFVGVYNDPETMRDVSSNVAAPWFAENIRPFLAGPTQRSAGEMVAGFVTGH